MSELVFNEVKGGGGPYAVETAAFKQATGAKAAITIVIDGKHGSGYSLAAEAAEDAVALHGQLVDILLDLARSLQTAPPERIVRAIPGDGSGAPS